MNLSLISSRADRLVWGSRERRSVMGRFLVPGTAPCGGEAGGRGGGGVRHAGEREGGGGRGGMPKVSGAGVCGEARRLGLWGDLDQAAEQ